MAISEVHYLEKQLKKIDDRLESASTPSERLSLYEEKGRLISRIEIYKRAVSF